MTVARRPGERLCACGAVSARGVAADGCWFCGAKPIRDISLAAEVESSEAEQIARARGAASGAAFICHTRYPKD